MNVLCVCACMICMHECIVSVCACIICMHAIIVQVCMSMNVCCGYHVCGTGGVCMHVCVHVCVCMYMICVSIHLCAVVNV